MDQCSVGNIIALVPSNHAEIVLQAIRESHAPLATLGIAINPLTGREFPSESVTRGCDATTCYVKTDSRITVYQYASDAGMARVSLWHELYQQYVKNLQ